ncbi:MAG TPA: SHOCT domain-containing protein [Solirubrobacterales bacterium]
MECVCGCGREISKNFSDRNFIAAGVAIELMAWDKNRALPGPEPEGREGLIARGVECYEKLLYSLHGEGGVDADAESNAWLAESRAMRAHRSDMTKRRFWGGSAPNVSKEDMDRLDRRHPERSFTGDEVAGREREAAGTPAMPSAPPGPMTATDDGDLVAKLERLRILRDDDVLTDEEFAAAKARLLGRG